MFPYMFHTGEASQQVDGRVGKLYHPLIMAVYDNDVELVRELLDSGVPVDFVDKHGHTPLQLAVRSGANEMVDLILERYPDSCPYWKDCLKKTVLVTALLNYKFNRMMVDRLLFDSKFSLVPGDFKDYRDVEILIRLIKCGFPYAVEPLLKSWSVYSLLMSYGLCCILNITKNPEHVMRVAKFLLNKGAQVSPTNDFGLTPLYYALGVDNVEYFELLLSKGAVDIVHEVEGICPLSNKKILSSNLHRTYFLAEHSHIRIQFDDDVNVARSKQEHFNILHRHRLKLRCLCRSAMDKHHSSVTKGCAGNFEQITTVDSSEFQKIQAEVFSLRKLKIADTTVSLFKLLIADQNQLASYAKNKDLVDALKKEDYSSKFPNYASMIKHKISRGVFRRNLLDVSTSFFLKIFPHLPDNCIELILRNLSDTELKFLVNFLAKK